MQISEQAITMAFDKCYTELSFMVVQIMFCMRERGKGVSGA